MGDNMKNAPGKTPGKAEGERQGPQDRPDWRDQTGRDRDGFLPSGGSETGATRGASHLPGKDDEVARNIRKIDDEAERDE